MMLDGELNRDSPGDDNVIEPAAAVLERVAAAQMRRDPSMSRAKAITAASMSKEYCDAARAEKVAKGWAG
jgi:hypothetical protein